MSIGPQNAGHETGFISPGTETPAQRDGAIVFEQFACIVMDGKLGRRLKPSLPGQSLVFDEYASQVTPSETVVVGHAHTDYASLTPVHSQADLEGQLLPNGTYAYTSVHGVPTIELEEASTMRGSWSSPQAVFDRFGPIQG